MPRNYKNTRVKDIVKRSKTLYGKSKEEKSDTIKDKDKLISTLLEIKDLIKEIKKYVQEIPETVDYKDLERELTLLETDCKLNYRGATRAIQEALGYNNLASHLANLSYNLTSKDRVKATVNPHGGLITDFKRLYIIYVNNSLTIINKAIDIVRNTITIKELNITYDTVSKALPVHNNKPFVVTGTLGLLLHGCFGDDILDLFLKGDLNYVWLLYQKAKYHVATTDMNIFSFIGDIDLSTGFGDIMDLILNGGLCTPLFTVSEVGEEYDEHEDLLQLKADTFKVDLFYNENITPESVSELHGFLVDSVSNIMKEKSKVLLETTMHLNSVSDEEESKELKFKLLKKTLQYYIMDLVKFKDNKNA